MRTFIILEFVVLSILMLQIQNVTSAPKEERDILTTTAISPTGTSAPTTVSGENSDSSSESQDSDLSSESIDGDISSASKDGDNSSESKDGDSSSASQDGDNSTASEVGAVSLAKREGYITIVEEDEDDEEVEDDNQDTTYYSPDDNGDDDDDDEEGPPLEEVITNAANSTKEFEFFYDSGTESLKLELDMVFSFDEYNALKEGADRRKRSAGIKIGSRTGQRWKNNIVYYQYRNYAFSSRDKKEIRAAIGMWEKYTCLDFRHTSRAKNRIVFDNGGGCFSRVGMVGGRQTIGLANGCRYRRIVAHEIGHALGMHHEQTRPDRDRYVRIIKRNVAPNLLYNFERKTWNYILNMGIPYDYRSIMHYGQYAFSVNRRTTIQTLNKNYQKIIGKGKMLSFGDIKAMNIMYNCKRHTKSCRKTKCPGSGFVNQDCKCWCPSGNPKDPVKLCGDKTTKPVTKRPTKRPATKKPATPRPTPRPSTCQDFHRSCTYWASVNECYKNPRYMLVYCKRACNKCHIRVIVEEDCEDKHEGCQAFSDAGYCRVGHKYAKLIRPRCKKSCRICSSASDQGGQRLKPSCTDDNVSLCPGWASSGYCTTNPGYMLKSCKKSCKQCGESTAPITNNVCRDSNRYCSDWARKGECRRNPRYMTVSCKRSCGLCGRG